MKRLPLIETEIMRARRKMCRKIAAVIIRAMADTDSDYEFIAMRIGKSEKEVERWIMDFVSGKSHDCDVVSDLCLAMGGEMEFTVVRYEEPKRPATEEPQPAAQAAA